MRLVEDIICSYVESCDAFFFFLTYGHFLEQNHGLITGALQSVNKSETQRHIAVTSDKAEELQFG